MCVCVLKSNKERGRASARTEVRRFVCVLVCVCLCESSTHKKRNFARYGENFVCGGGIMCIYIHRRVNVYTFMYMHVHVHIYTSVYIHVYVCRQTDLHTGKKRHTKKRLYVIKRRLCVWGCIINKYTYVYMNICIQIHVRTHVCMYIYICICTYICI